jgi:dipeptidyl aminopeptidase/acylaminoacyl peptidase
MELGAPNLQQFVAMVIVVLSNWLVLTPDRVHAQAATEPPSMVVRQEPCTPFKPYRDLDAFGKWYFAESTYEDVRLQTDDECSHIWYRSDEATVSGYIFKPKVTGTRLWPVILYARGGTGNFGLISDLERVNLYLLAKEGYVVVATEYRWTGDQGRRDEWGGKDVDDLLNLVPLAKSLDYIDPHRIFLLGASRGGTMVYLAIKHGIPVRAAAVIAGVTDLEAEGTYRPEFINGDADYDGWAKVWPDFQHRKEEEFRARSAVAWADQLNVPLLILHSRTDSRVPVSHALAISEKLTEGKKEYELVIYGDDGHSLPKNRKDANEHIIRWFRAHEEKAGESPAKTQP